MKTTTPNLRHRQLASARNLGVTMIELMVAVALGLIILGVVGQVYLTSRATYTVEEGLARVQEGGRFSMEFLSLDIRMAGFLGCNSDLPPGSINNIADPSTAAYQMLAGGVRGYRYVGPGTATTAWDPDLPTDFFSDGNVRAGTDVIVTQRASTLDTNLTANMNVENANVQILATAAIRGEIQDDDILIISDCSNADVFRANNVSNSGGKTTIAHSESVNSSNNLSKTYDTKAQIMKLVSRAYYIGNNPRSGEPGLMRKDLVRATAVPPIAAQELVEGVEDMRILYGYDTDSPQDYIPNRYLQSNDPNLAEWTRVVNVRIGLLLRTPSNVGDVDTLQYNLPGVTVGPFNDPRRRHVFTTTIQIRNAGT